MTDACRIRGSGWKESTTLRRWKLFFNRVIWFLVAFSSSMASECWLFLNKLSLTLFSFLLFFFFSLEIHAWHLRFQGSPLSWTYLSISSQFFWFIIFFLSSFVSFLFFSISSFNLIFLFFFKFSPIFFLVSFVNFQLF
jgi:hypothetical protein